METITATQALDSFGEAQDGYLQAMRQVPPGATGYLKPGDDYSIGGIAVHVTYVLEHYANVLDGMIAAGFGECRPEDPPGLEARAQARANASLDADEVAAELARGEQLHAGLVTTIEGLGEGWTRESPVYFGDAAETYSTSAATVLEWLTGHYQEHVPQLATLVEEWRAQSAGAPEAGALEVVTKFNEAFGRADVDAVMALMTDDCVFDNTYPPPDGELFRGRDQVRRFWEGFFASTESPRFETEEIFAAGDRVVSRWRYSWGEGASGGHVRGADLFLVRDGKVAEKRSYVKG
jgi:ketosteroid isomerase-like protein